MLQQLIGPKYFIRVEEKQWQSWYPVYCDAALADAEAYFGEKLTAIRYCGERESEVDLLCAKR